MAKSKTKQDTPCQIMVVNDVPGEECRIAILENGMLEELYSERTATATGVGNIYKGRVVNVEPSIQAAFIDYGSGKNGFLHISDLHPRYFPSGDKTERVGKKIPRRDRPPIQEALKRGDSLLVQVIKEGIGTKGPTLTSYISIPGRLMVMMPDMDRTGVSRKIEDEDMRREMRTILDSLELPEGFGFILRTAGFGQSKTELKRDLAYLNRLWKMMESRIKNIQAPCPLYVESDLLIRTIRDVLTTDVDAIVIDSESGCQRAQELLRVITPRSAPKVIRYNRNTPIFHAFNVETQIDLIHSREVPLPSGGAIVIEQTEALVAIDVNSGRSRGARDSETNAFKTNSEAADEICRQLRLRDLGGLVINDLIDMVRRDNRRDIEKRFRDNLAHDRAKTTVARISEFGILEMTRQRMRPSMRKTHYQSCTQCNGHGEIRTAESMAGEVLRHAAFLLQHERVCTVEIVCAPQLAAAFLSSKRRELVRLEDTFNKTVRIRVNENMQTDKIDYYAYDNRSADIDITRLPEPAAPDLKELLAEEKMVNVESKEDGAPAKRKRKRRRSKKVATLEDALKTSERAGELDIEEQEEKPAGEVKTETDVATTKKKRRRRRRRSTVESTAKKEAVSTDDEEQKSVDSDSKKKTRTKTRSRVVKKQSKKTSKRAEKTLDAKEKIQKVKGTAAEDEKPAKKLRRKRSRRPSRKKSGSSKQSTKQETVPAPTSENSKSEPKPPVARRTLYQSRSKKLPSTARDTRDRDE